MGTKPLRRFGRHSPRTDRSMLSVALLLAALVETPLDAESVAKPVDPTPCPDLPGSERPNARRLMRQEVMGSPARSTGVDTHNAACAR